MTKCPYVSRLEGVDITKLQEEMKDFYERIVMGKEYYNGGQFGEDIDLGEEYGLEQKVFGDKILKDEVKNTRTKHDPNARHNRDTTIGAKVKDVRGTNVESQQKLQANFIDNGTERGTPEGGISLYDKASPISTRLLKEYNLLLWPQYSQMYPLYKNICRIFREVCDNTHHQYYTQAWLNYCHKGEYIADHTHWAQSKRAYHGFICVDSEGSDTRYILGPNSEASVENENGLFCLCSCEYIHGTKPWPKDKPRITLAFDVVPKRFISFKEYWAPNHWCPIA